MDPEINGRFERLEDALVRLTDRVDNLAEAQNGLTATVSVLASAQARTEEKLEALTATVNVLASAQVRLTEAQARLTEAQARTEERLGRMSDAMIRGFTDGTTRDADVTDRLERIERKLDKDV